MGSFPSIVLLCSLAPGALLLWGLQRPCAPAPSSKGWGGVRGLEVAWGEGQWASPWTRQWLCARSQPFRDTAWSPN